jgi:pyrroloquinoline-quinone synthase
MTTTVLERRAPQPAAVVAGLQAASAQLPDRVLRHPFLTGCANGTVSLDQLRSFLAQHGKYSRYFTRYLCALISQLDEADDVLRLADNLAEDSRIYADMLKDFGIDLDAQTPT